MYIIFLFYNTDNILGADAVVIKHPDRDTAETVNKILIDRRKRRMHLAADLAWIPCAFVIAFKAF